MQFCWTFQVSDIPDIRIYPESYKHATATMACKQEKDEDLELFSVAIKPQARLSKVGFPCLALWFCMVYGI